MAKRSRILSDFLHPLWAVVFALMAGLWVAHAYWPLSDAPAYRRFTRIAGYLATLAMLIPYLHILRRFFRYRHWGYMSRWLQWHAGAAYLAFFLTLLHCRGRANSTLTLAIVLFLWAVMLSGILGFFGLKALYRLMTLAVKRELGLERLEAERLRLAERGRMLIDDYSLFVPDDVRDWAKLVEALNAKTTPLGAAVAKELSGADKKFFDALKLNPEDEEARAHVTLLLNGRAPGGKKRSFTLTLEALPAEKQPADELIFLVKRNEAELTPAEQKRKHRLFMEALAPELFVPSSRLEQAVERFFAAAGTEYLQPGFADSWLGGGLGSLAGRLAPMRAGRVAPAASWRWMFTRSALDRAAGGYWQRAREVAAGRQQAIVDELWSMMDSRRQMNVEYWFHRLARVWLLVHGPAAAALFVLIAIHIATSVWYGGY